MRFRAGNRFRRIRTPHAGSGPPLPCDRTGPTPDPEIVRYLFEKAAVAHRHALGPPRALHRLDLLSGHAYELPPLPNAGGRARGPSA